MPTMDLPSMHKGVVYFLTSNFASRTALDGEADVAATSTLSESECDEGATIRPDPIDPAAASEVVIPSHSPLKPTASK